MSLAFLEPAHWFAFTLLCLVPEGLRFCLEPLTEGAGGRCKVRPCLTPSQHSACRRQRQMLPEPSRAWPSDPTALRSDLRSRQALTP